MSEKQIKKVKETTVKLAVAAMSAKAFENFDSDELAQYCWDVAAAIDAFDDDDIEEDDDE